MAIDPKLPPRTNYCKCSGCGLYFNSEYPFRMHRAGKPDNRRCLTVEEMTKKGMSLSKREYWVSETLDSGKLRLATSGDSTND